MLLFFPLCNATSYSDDCPYKLPTSRLWLESILILIFKRIYVAIYMNFTIQTQIFLNFYVWYKLLYMKNLSKMFMWRYWNLRLAKKVNWIENLTVQSEREVYVNHYFQTALLLKMILRWSLGSNYQPADCIYIIKKTVKSTNILDNWMAAFLMCGHSLVNTKTEYIIW